MEAIFPLANRVIAVSRKIDKQSKRYLAKISFNTESPSSPLFSG
jgi:hypothetical protein